MSDTTLGAKDAGGESLPIAWGKVARWKGTGTRIWRTIGSRVVEHQWKLEFERNAGEDGDAHGWRWKGRLTCSWRARGEDETETFHGEGHTTTEALLSINPKTRQYLIHVLETRSEGGIHYERREFGGTKRGYIGVDDTTSGEHPGLAILIEHICSQAAHVAGAEWRAIPGDPAAPLVREDHLVEQEHMYLRYHLVLRPDGKEPARIENLQFVALKLDGSPPGETPLTHFSAGPHPYWNGQTPLRGALVVHGNPGDVITDVTLEVREAGALIAVGQLTAPARSALIGKIPESGCRAVPEPIVLSSIDSHGMSGVDAEQNAGIHLRVKAKLKSGDQAEGDFGPVQKLVRYTGRNRYGPRDHPEGGDDWVLPSVKQVIEHFNQVDPEFLWGDFSNMHGGPFRGHKSHRVGTDVDGWFPRYQYRDAAAAARIIRHLNDPRYGSRIEAVFVTYSKTSRNLFWNAIKDVQLRDERKARDVILPEVGHERHFHWRIRP